MKIREINRNERLPLSNTGDVKVWGLFEYVEKFSTLSWAERATHELNIPLIYSSLSVMLNTIINNASVENVHHHYWAGDGNIENPETSHDVEDFINTNALYELPAGGRSTGRFVIVTYGSRASSLGQIDMYYAGLSMPEIVGLLDVSINRFRGTLTEHAEDPVLKKEEFKDRSSAALAQLLEGLTFHAPESDLNIDEAWALVQSENQAGDVNWHVASSKNVDRNFLIGALSDRIHELRAWIAESYSEDEVNPFIESGEPEEVDSNDVAIEDDQSLSVEDRRLEQVLVEIDHLSLNQKVTVVYLWVFGRNAKGGAATNFILAESEESNYSDNSGYIELGLLVMEKNKIMSNQ